MVVEWAIDTVNNNGGGNAFGDDGCCCDGTASK